MIIDHPSSEIILMLILKPKRLTPNLNIFRAEKVIPNSHFESLDKKFSEIPNKSAINIAGAPQ